jgi:hypothetical protein
MSKVMYTCSGSVLDELAARVFAKGSPENCALGEIADRSRSTMRPFGAGDGHRVLVARRDRGSRAARCGDARGASARRCSGWRRARSVEALVGLAEVGVGVDVQHAEAGPALGVGARIDPKGTRVIAADEADDLAPRSSRFAVMPVHALVELVSPARSRAARRACEGGRRRRRDAAGRDDGGREAAQASCVPRERSRRILGEQGDAGLVRAAGVSRSKRSTWRLAARIAAAGPFAVPRRYEVVGSHGTGTITTRACFGV